MYLQLIHIVQQIGQLTEVRNIWFFTPKLRAYCSNMYTVGAGTYCLNRKILNQEGG